MDFEVLPGPSLAELARTALASAAAAEIDDARSPGDPAYPGRVPAQVPVRDGRDGSPLLLPVTGSVLEHQLAARTRGGDRDRARSRAVLGPADSPGRSG